MAAPLQHSFFTKVLFISLILIITSSLVSSHSRRILLELEDDNNDSIIKTKSNPSPKIPSKNTTKLIKSTSSPSKNQTKLINTSSNDAFKNQTKLLKPPSGSTKNTTKLIKTTSLNSTSTPHFKKLNLTSSPPKKTSFSTKKSPDLPKNNKPQMEKTVLDPKSNKKPLKKPTQIDLDDNDDDDDFVAEFRDLPTKFQESIVPDLERISKSSRGYLTSYNKEFTRGFKPYVGNKYASTIASLVSFAFIIIPLILVSLIFSKIKAYFSLQKLLIFIQIYLSIYFTILCLSSLATGLEPLKFFYSTSQSTYVCIQVLQTLAYVLYLLLLLMYLILVFSTETPHSTKLLGLGQTLVGFAVGLHYYVTVFHRAVLHQPPKTSWKAHALYAACFLVICLLGRVDRRKKAYLEGEEEGKMS